MIKLYNDDVYNLIEFMERNNIKVDHIITDPPYNISRKNNFKSMGRSSLDFGEWDKGFDQYTWILKSYNLLKRGGSLIIFNDWKNIGQIARYAEQVGYQIKDPIRWVKDNPIPRNRDRRYITDYEVAVWLVKPGGKWVFNRLNDTYDRPEYNYPVVSGKEKTGHPTQKPLGLMREILKRHTEEGDLIADFFAGSGTTAEACQLENRRFIGSEIDEEYYKDSLKRLGGK